MTEQQARKWLKTNWKRLIKEKRLDEALDRYFKQYSEPVVLQEEQTDEAIKILGGKML